MLQYVTDNIKYLTLEKLPQLPVTYRFFIILAILFGAWLIYFLATDFVFSLFYYLYNFKKLDYRLLGSVLFLAIYLATIIVITNNLNKKNNIIKNERDELRLINERYTKEIEKRKRTEKSLKIAEQSLEQSTKLAEIGQMSAAINHEISQPLLALRTYLNNMRILIERNRVEEAKSNFQRVDDLIQRMEKITTQLKILSGKNLTSTYPLNLLEVIEPTINMITPHLIDKGIKLNYIPPSKEITVIADEIKLQQIIINLLNNAIDAVQNNKHGNISVEFIYDYSSTKIFIIDNGHGIKDLDNIFEPFYTTKEPGKGVGLGLSISAELASKFGGKLIANNLEKAGSQFILEIKNG